MTKPLDKLIMDLGKKGELDIGIVHLSDETKYSLDTYSRKQVSQRGRYTS